MDLDPESSESSSKDESADDGEEEPKYTNKWLQDFLQHWREHRAAATADEYFEAERGRVNERIKATLDEEERVERQRSSADAINITRTSPSTPSASLDTKLTLADKVRTILGRVVPGQANPRTTEEDTRTGDPHRHPLLVNPPADSIAVYAASVPERGKSLFLEDKANGDSQVAESEEDTGYRTASTGEDTAVGSDGEMTDAEGSEDDEESDDEGEPMSVESTDDDEEEQDDASHSGDSMPPLESVDSDSNEEDTTDLPAVQRVRPSILWIRRYSARESLHDYEVMDDEEADERAILADNAALIHRLRREVESNERDSQSEHEVMRHGASTDHFQVNSAAPSCDPLVADALLSPATQFDDSQSNLPPTQGRICARTLVNDSPVIVYPWTYRRPTRYLDNRMPISTTRTTPRNPSPLASPSDTLIFRKR
ncbi:hypothetical protein FA95DRAFT_1578197 [Auriscalpium vulgare]|uniref:Uncharacterized protein n=1 Tax=Auriscalpium vulgare TaxID=40419 RepID=A0ACB8R2V4_9AGAM|nr:hypothetical protein FA95DRAFT_1578197 [Auriscalpium vulgare]